MISEVFPNTHVALIPRVWGIGIVDRLCRLKLDFEAVVEDANEDVYSFQIQRSLIYLKFVGVVHYLILSQNHTKNRLFIGNPSLGGVILLSPIVLNCSWDSAVKHSLNIFKIVY